MKKYSLKQALDDFGPVLAGFQIAASVVGFFGIGAFASWVIERWLPFTRWVWAEIFKYIQFPDISDPEKDALTAIAFFTPMAISALLNRNSLEESTPENKSKLLRVRIYALVIGVIFMYLVGSRVVLDMIDMVGNFELVAIQRAIIIMQAPVLIVPVIPVVYRQYVTKFTTLRDDNPEKFSRNLNRILKYSQIAVFLALFVIVAGGGIWLASAGIGWIRAFAPLLVLICLGVTVIFHPNRLLNTAGVVIAFVISSVGWEVALYVVEVIETAPTGT
ncbi:hypothetical protein KUV99_14805 [Vibrio harveyi]|uniref:hypothetical protein n=1 Tax=Vibrio harveyi TaxID=669 RepID=UPI001C98546F|nr:hypothetical protein [Vibrio harveyi]MBY6237430.1 hypothetical protein [Vibrio harveyi]